MSVFCHILVITLLILRQMPYMITIKRAYMNSKKIFLLPVIISFIGHAALISAGSIIDLRAGVKSPEPFMVKIAEPRAETKQKTEEKKPQAQKDAQRNEEIKPLPSRGREDTVAIGSSDIKYAAYLAGVKKKIMRLWQYPAGAYQNSEEGEVVIRMSVDEDGSLAGIELVSSSGSNHLDSGTIGTVQAASPFQPLPSRYNLSRLHIIASFHYRMRD